MVEICRSYHNFHIMSRNILTVYPNTRQVYITTSVMSVVLSESLHDVGASFVPAILLLIVYRITQPPLKRF